MTPAGCVVLKRPPTRSDALVREHTSGTHTGTREKEGQKERQRQREATESELSLHLNAALSKGIPLLSSPFFPLYLLLLLSFFLHSHFLLLYLISFLILHPVSSPLTSARFSPQTFALSFLLPLFPSPPSLPVFFPPSAFSWIFLLPLLSLLFASTSLSSPYYPSFLRGHYTPPEVLVGWSKTLGNLHPHLSCVELRVVPSDHFCNFPKTDNPTFTSSVIWAEVRNFSLFFFLFIPHATISVPFHVSATVRMSCRRENVHCYPHL